MSKSDTPLDYIETDRARKPLGKPDFAEDTAIAGLDTETADGDIFCIGAYYEDTEHYREVAAENGETLSGLEVIDFLTSGGMRNRMNVWYNLNFDANVVLKALPRKNLEEIRVHNSTTWNKDGKEYEITYIPKKCLTFSVDGNSYRHFDASQFTYVSGGLDVAASEWLGDDRGKANENVDVTAFGLKDDGSLNDYVTENLSEILRYLRVDCKLTAEIMREIIDTAENGVDPAIPFGSPFSTGYVAADYIRNRLDYKPGYANTEIQSAAWKTYYGGRFEVIRRGYVGEVAGPDINSAYPAVMADLPDPSTLEWYGYGSDNRLSAVSEADIDGADYGFVEVEVTTDPERPVQPFAVKNPDMANRCEYPAIDGATIWTLVDTFRFARDNDMLVDYDVKTAYLGFETETTKKPFSFFRDLYAQRKAFEAEDKPKAAKLLKIVMNSIYGKTCQSTMKLKPIADFAEENDLSVVTTDDVPDKYETVTDPSGETFLEYQTAGRLFNPFLATYITGRTRLKLLRGVVENDLEDNVVMLATDCLMFDKDAFESSPLYEAAERDESPREALGGWDYDYVGEAFVVGSGVYQVNRTDKDEVKHGMRGFKDFYGSDGDETLMERAEKSPDGIPLENTRPVTYGDILHKGGKLSEIGRFRETERTLSADMDTKRSWQAEDINFSDLLNNDEYGAPKIYDGTTVREQ